MLKGAKKDEANIDDLVNGLKGVHTEYNVEPTIIQSYQHLIQYVSNLALHVLASVPEFKHRPGPGVNFFSQKEIEAVAENFDL